MDDFNFDEEFHNTVAIDENSDDFVFDAELMNFAMTDIDWDEFRLSDLENHNENHNIDLELEFTNWLRNKKKDNGEDYSENTINSYCEALRCHLHLLSETTEIKFNGIYKNIFFQTNLNIFKVVKSEIRNDQSFKYLREQGSNLVTALNHYETFLGARNAS